ncbi:MAG: beta-propeller domain-containing protein [Desulfobacteraceae bacterium]|jgi:uncharacterized secreted protein with C-terminal beta-propeller domain
MSLLIDRKLKLYIMLTFFLSMSFITGCGGDITVGTDVGDASYVPMNYDELEIYIKKKLSESALPSDAYVFETREVPVEFRDVANAYANNYSQTNIQEIDVDEADKVKTDGVYLYIAGKNAVHIVNAVPADSMDILGTITVNGAVDSLYLNNNTLVILYQFSEGSSLTWTAASPCLGFGISYCAPVQAQLGVMMIDVSDPSSPGWIREWAFDGWMVSSRLTDGKLHIVQKFFPDLPPLQLTYGGTEEGRAEAIAANELALEAVTIDELIPYYDVIDEQGNTVSRAPLTTLEDFYYPDDSNGGSIVSIVTIDLFNPSAGFQSTGLIADAHTVYASTEALYVVSSQWNHESKALGETKEYFRTDLYKFSLTDTKVTLEGTGSVRGKILNQFSLSEYDNVLRIATASMTTIEGVWGVTNENNIYCLKSGNFSLDIIGSLEGIAPGEDIYAARFIGDRGFLVTFVKVDPLFTIDLSDPTNPVVAGELHVPGYSDYIHPFGDDHLITIGKDTVLDGYGTSWYQGLQLSIFDISDFAYPQLLHKELIGDRGTNSEALDNHKAFTFRAENGLLAIPVRLYEHQGQPNFPYSYGELTFDGLYVYRITIEEGFEYLGRISTNDNPNITYNNLGLRGVFIEEDVYAVNEEAVRSSNIDDVGGTVNLLSFPNGD